MTKKIASMLSLCMKAGKLRTGEYAGEKLLKLNEAALVITAADASANTKKKFGQKCFYYNIPYICYGDKDELSRCVGQENRTVMTVTDAGFANKLIKLINEDSAGSPETNQLHEV